MKKIKLILLTAFSICAFAGTNIAYGFSVIKHVNDASPSAAAFKYLKVSDFVKLSAKEFSDLTGKKMNFFERLSFKVTKMRMKHDLKKNPDLKITDYMKPNSTTFQIDILWLLLGVLLGPIGVLIAYVTKQEQYKLTSSWIGFGIFVLIILLFRSSIF